MEAKTKKSAYSKVTIEEADGGWIVIVKGTPPLLCYKWQSVIWALEEAFTIVRK